MSHELVRMQRRKNVQGSLNHEHFESFKVKSEKLFRVQLHSNHLYKLLNLLFSDKPRYHFGVPQHLGQLSKRHCLVKSFGPIEIVVVLKLLNFVDPFVRILAEDFGP